MTQAVRIRNKDAANKMLYLEAGNVSIVGKLGPHWVCANYHTGWNYLPINST